MGEDVGVGEGVDAGGGGGWGEIEKRLRSLRGRARRLLVAERLGLVVAAVVAAGVGLGALDFALRLPGVARFVLVVVAAVLAGRFVWTRVWPGQEGAARFSPSLTTVASRVEAATPGLRGVLASAVDFSRWGEGDAAGDGGRGGGAFGHERSATESALAGSVVKRAAAGVGEVRAGVLLKPERARRGLGLAAGALAVLVVIGSVAPGAVGTAAQRLVLPFSDAAWPKRTQLADGTRSAVHPAGEAVTLRAIVLRSPTAKSATDVFVEWEAQAEGGEGGERGEVVARGRELMTYQGLGGRGMADRGMGDRGLGDRGSAAIGLDGDEAVGGAVESGEGVSATAGVFERPVTAGAGVLRYRFAAGDDRTGWRELRLVERPRVVDAVLEVTPPEYAREALGRERREVGLGAGDDERAVAPAALEGAEGRLVIRLNKAARARVTASGDGVGVASELGSEPVEGGEGTAGAVYAAEVRLGGRTRVEVELEDAFGIGSSEPAVFVLTGVADREPSVTVVEPAGDETVLATAVVELRAEGRDDVGLAGVGLASLHERPEAGPGATAAPGLFVAVGPGRVLSAVEVQASGRTGTAEAVLDLAVMEAAAGDRIEVTGLAIDARGAWSSAGVTEAFASAAAAEMETPDETRGDPFEVETKAAARVAKSTVRVLRVIDETDFIDEVRDALADVRDAAIRAESDQAGVQRDFAERGATRELRRGQAQVTARVERQREAVEALRERVERNRLEDGTLDDLLGRVETGLRRAAESSERASQRMDAAAAAQDAEGREAGEGAEDDGEGEAGAEEAGSAEAGDDEAGVEEGGELGAEAERAAEGERAREDAAIAQDEVRDELAEVAGALDRGEDDWAIRNALERSLREQRNLRERTAELAEDAAGRTLEQLTEEQRRRLEGIVQDQAELAERAERTLEQMRERAERMQETDPVGADAMREAARNANERGLPGAMERAAEAAEGNRTNDAQEQQQRAEEALERALEDMNRTERAREEVLRRLLASVSESLRALIERQEAELGALAAAMGAGRALAELAPGMIELAANTAAVVDTLRQGGPELNPVSNLVERANEAQTAAIRELRSPEADADAVERHERRSLALLRDALSRAEEIDESIEQRQQERAVEELRSAYAELLARAVELRGEVERYVGVERLSRRDRAALRRSAADFDELLPELDGLEASVAELDAAAVRFAHERARRSAGVAGERLREARVGAGMRDAERLAATLRSLVRTLSDAQADDRPFDDGSQQGGGGGGGGGQGGEQPAAVPASDQLRLVRMIQEDIAARTRAVDGMPAGGERAEAIRELAEETRELTRVGKRVLEEAMQGRNLDRFLPGSRGWQPAGDGDAAEGDGATGEGDGENGGGDGGVENDGSRGENGGSR